MQETNSMSVSSHEEEDEDLALGDCEVVQESYRDNSFRCVGYFTAEKILSYTTSLHLETCNTKIDIRFSLDPDRKLDISSLQADEESRMFIEIIPVEPNCYV